MCAALVRPIGVDRLAVVGAAVDEQREAVVGHAGVRVDAAAVARVAVVLASDTLPGSPKQVGLPHVADRAAEGGRVLAHQPAVRVLGRASPPRDPHRHVDAAGELALLIALPFGSEITERRDRDRRIDALGHVLDRRCRRCWR